MVKNLPANVGDIRDVGLIPVSERSPGGVPGRLHIHRVSKSWTQLK